MGNHKLQQIIKESSGEIIKVLKDIRERHYETLGLIAEKIVNSYNNLGKVIICGNGGSYADALHFAGELEGAYLNRERAPLPVIVLSNPATLTAVANDFGYKEIFARNIRANANKGDVVIGFSTSGSSRNIIEAFRESKAKKATTIAFTGARGMKEAELVDIIFSVNSTDTPRIQEAHTFAFHEICGIVERELFACYKNLKV